VSWRLALVLLLLNLGAGVASGAWADQADTAIELVKEPVWVHPSSGQQVAPGPANPLGSRWIGFFEDCTPRRGFNGVRQAMVRGCASAGFHGTPQRSSIGRAVSHGCVRLLEEHIRELFELVELGTPVTVLP
jgi:L,D-transpeptidase ErfK/SrfK